jgi:hypothetical protein
LSAFENSMSLVEVSSVKNAISACHEALS